MKKLYGKLNRYRGLENKILGISAMWGIFFLFNVPAIWFRPDVMGFDSVWQLGLFSLCFFGFLAKYLWFWGSAAFPQYRDTVQEVKDGDLLCIAKWYADKVRGQTYTTTLSETKSIMWKQEAHKAVCVFRYLFGYLIIGICSLNPFLMVLGLRGLGVAKVYREEFKIVDDPILHRVETRFGEGDFYWLATATTLIYIQTIAMRVWM